MSVPGAHPPEEVPLPGGNVSSPVRVGDTVRRIPGERAYYVQRLLTFLADAGWAGAPRHLGRDEHGREMLTHLDGDVPWQRPPATPGSDDALAAATRLARELHDLTAGTPLAGHADVVCHHDLAPRNTVHGPDGLPYAFLDWDLAGPGRRLDDVAHLAWQFCPLEPGADPHGAARRLAVVRTAYGPLCPPGELLDAVLRRQLQTADGIEAEALEGHPAMIRLRDTGVPAAVRAANRWTAAHRDVLAGDG